MMSSKFLNHFFASSNIQFSFFSKIIAVALIVLTCSTSNAQLIVTAHQTAEELVKNLVGPGVTTLNPVISCPSSANGIFTVTKSNINIKGGIILCTGNANSAVGPASVLADVSNSSRGDEDLTKLSGQPTYDACKLEFDFIPTGETVKFRYVFGSEEYPSFACTQYNDVFAFFISGPGYSAQKNIALIPGTDIPVAINSTAGIVGTSGGNLSICESMGRGSPFKEYYVNNNDGTTITYNGFTKVFTAVAAVKPCATYHLKLAIADAKDHQYDSGVFIEEGSLSSNSLSVSTRDNLQVPVPYCVKGCKNGIFEFKRKYPTSLPLTIHYNIKGTAVNGKDYKNIPDSITIPAYDTVATRTIMPLMVASSEPKTIQLYIYDPFSCNIGKYYADSAKLAIYDSLFVQVNSPDTLICNGARIHILTTGDESLAYSWSPSSGLNSADAKSPITTPTGSITYRLTASLLSSICPPVHAQARLNMPGMTLELKGNMPCPGGTLQILAGNIKGAKYQWTGPNGFTSSEQNVSISNMSVQDTGVYTLSVAMGGCKTSGKYHVSTGKEPIISIQPKPVTICSGSNANFSVHGSGSNVSYQWQAKAGYGFANISNSETYSGTKNNSLNINGTTMIMNGYTYKCIITGPCSSVSSDAAMLTVNDVPIITEQSPSKTACAGKSTTFYVNAKGNNIKYQWQISNGGEFSVIKNSSAYANVNTNTLLITNVSGSMNNYRFRCLISGDCMPSMTSNPDTINVTIPTIINRHPANMSVCAGSDATFSISAAGTKINYQWMVNAGSGFTNIKDGGPYSGSQTNTLQIMSVTKEMNTYQYQCIVSGNCETSVTSNIGRLAVNTNPTIVMVPNDHSICVSGHTIFSTAGSGGNLSYQWYVNAGSGFIPISNNVIYNGALSNTLTVTRALASMSGYKYQCHISGPCGEPIKTSIVSLRVDSMPVITTQPVNSSVCGGNSTSFAVSAVGGSDLSYQWQYSQGASYVNLADDENYSGALSGNLSVKNINTTMNGYLYKCIISSTCSTPVTSRPAMLTTNGMPTITKQPVNTKFCMGGTVNFSLSASGSNLSYQWQADTGAGFNDIQNKGNYNGAYTNSISIKGATSAMSGYKFRCMVSGDCKPGAISNTATLTVNTWPSIKAKGNVLSAGDYKSYQWYFNNSPIPGATSPTYTATKSGAYSVFITDDNGCIDLSSQYIVNSTGTDTATTTKEYINIYPNPATSIVHFDAPMKVNVSISNSHGKVVMHKDNAKAMDITKLQNGVYIIQVYDEKKKLIKTDKLLKSSW